MVIVLSALKQPADDSQTPLYTPGWATTRWLELASEFVISGGVVHLKISVLELQVPVSVALPFLQITLLSLITLGACGCMLTATLVVADAVQPASLVIVTE